MAVPNPTNVASTRRYETDHPPKAAIKPRAGPSVRLRPRWGLSHEISHNGRLTSPLANPRPRPGTPALASEGIPSSTTTPIPLRRRTWRGAARARFRVTPMVSRTTSPVSGTSVIGTAASILLPNAGYRSDVLGHGGEVEADGRWLPLTKRTHVCRKALNNFRRCGSNRFLVSFVHRAFTRRPLSAYLTSTLTASSPETQTIRVLRPATFQQLS